jgi:2-amino-4-hydroxy-6-hydroxymethyldihydropteridine diphosphokinase
MTTAAKSHWLPAYIGLGSNLNEPVRQLEEALQLLKALPSTRLVRHSSLYRTAPYGGVSQPDFVNAVAAVLTQLRAPALLRELQKIEKARGRKRGAVRWGPRILDLDLLVYSGDLINERDLIVPHPGIAERNFVLLPLLEIAPDLRIPGLGRVSSLNINLVEPAISRIV